MRTVHDIPVLRDIPVLVRAALNVPIEHGGVANDYRLRRALPTLQYLSERGARIVLVSHIGDKGTETLKPVADALSRLIPNVSFCETTIGEAARQAVRALHPGHILVLENVRRDRGETENDPLFAKELALLADVFVQDSFDTCHRMHASVVGVPKLLPSYAGILLAEEVQELAKAMRPGHPALAVIGGAKFSTKEPVLKSLLKVYDHVFVGGALANDFLKASGHDVGVSLVSGAPADDIRTLLENEKLVVPTDVVVTTPEESGTPDARTRARVTEPRAVGKNESILDVGPTTSALLAELARTSKTILWNGPLGNYEHGFTDATDALARAIGASNAHSVIGGGDTIAAIEKLGTLS
ncbi:MAG TPA: phosphoglycerate kinase, partial [Candidatus Paceibacterota bacterium]|nr:phosphoglycerate kinase [Candidatus Paceibacterota bacterium]